MDFLDDLPQRSETHNTAELAETAFAASISSQRLFIVQRRDRSDYGTDFQLEACHSDSMTNLRVHVQLKGTNSTANVDGSVSVAIARTNLNYLLAQTDSIFVCYHIPTQRLLVSYAHEVYREYERREGWQKQGKITVRLVASFDEAFQQTLHKRALAIGSSLRDRRMEWTTTPPERVSAVMMGAIPLVEVPSDPGQAKAVLAHLYRSAQDAVISRSFSRFAAVLDSLPGAMDLAYMAEINLGLNHLAFDTDRVRKGIEVIEEAILRGDQSLGPLLYSQGNAWAALGQAEKAKEAYHQALLQLDDPRLRGVAAQCTKNMGTVLYELGHIDTALAFYQRALTLDPGLAEAHVAMALWYRRHSENYVAALAHLDSVIRRQESSLPMHTVIGWRIELLFKNGETDAAFREISNLIGVGDSLEWVRPWCARQVLTFGKQSVHSARRAVQFWDRFLREDPGNYFASKERLLCLLYLRADGAELEITFDEFKGEASRLANVLPVDAAFLWDRVGHWAQYDGNWSEAEYHYRKAYELEPRQFGYCLGTALNFLDRSEEALPILWSEIEESDPDA